MTLKYTNVAEISARLAVQNALCGNAERQSRLTIPWCTYCSPEIAHIGMRRLANIVHAYPAQSDAIRLAALAYVDSHTHGRRRTL
jgi:hypothetical protein